MEKTKAKKRKKRMRMFLVCLGITALVALTTFFEFRSDSWATKIKKLYVLGTTEIPTVDLHALLGVQKGDHLFGDWKTQAKEKLEANPWIANAAIVRNLTGDVVVQIAERKAAAYLNIDRLYAVDSEGNILGPVKNQPKEVKGLLVISGPWKKKSSYEEIGLKVHEAMNVRNAWIKEGNQESEISELHFDSKKGWTMYRVGLTARCILGQGPFERKIVRLQRVLKDFVGKENQLKEIDVDFDDRAVVKLSG